MVGSGLEGALLLAGRVLFGGILALMGLNHFLNLDEMAGYAEYKGLPAARLSVVASGVVLVLGGLALVVGAFPVLGAIVVAAFLVAAAVTMHDFWAVPEEEQQTEMTQFLKNIALAGGALAFAAVGTASEWAYSAGLTAF